MGIGEGITETQITGTKKSPGVMILSRTKRRTAQKRVEPITPQPSRIGYDGNPPEFGIKRGSEIRDAFTGKVVREGEPSPVNLNVDRIEWLFAHKKIMEHQYRAARQLQGDCQMAEIINYASPALVGGGNAGGALSDAKIDAMKRVNAARAAFEHYWPGWKLIELVAVENYSMEKACVIMLRPRKWGPSAFGDALDILAKHYGLA